MRVIVIVIVIYFLHRQADDETRLLHGYKTYYHKVLVIDARDRAKAVCLILNTLPVTYSMSSAQQVGTSFYADIFFAILKETEETKRQALYFNGCLFLEGTRPRLLQE